MSSPGRVRTDRRPRITATIYDKRGRTLSVGENSYTKTHTKQARFARLAGQPLKVYLHAEICALVRCRELGRAYRIVVERNGKDGVPRLAKPCPVCELAIKEAGIERVEYTL